MEEFLERVFGDLEGVGLDVSRYQMDHVCFRTSSQESYIHHKNQYSKIAKLLIESEIHGRMISTFELSEPIYFKDRVIRIVELPAPKAGSDYPDGYEHVEFVCDCDFTEIQKQAPSLPWKLSSKVFNSEMRVKLPNCCVKFHHQSLKSVVEIEKNEKLFSELKPILKHLQKYSPLVSGSVPLDIQTSQSDLDLIFSAQNFDEFVTDINQISTQVEVYKKDLRGIPSVIARFQTPYAKYECVAQNKSVFEIIAHQHFLVESRLLNIAGEKARHGIQKLKNSGVPTEPAFVEYFKIKGEPYQTLLEWNQKSESELFHSVTL